MNPCVTRNPDLRFRTEFFTGFLKNRDFWLHLNQLGNHFFQTNFISFDCIFDALSFGGGARAVPCPVNFAVPAPRVGALPRKDSGTVRFVSMQAFEWYKYYGYSCCSTGARRARHCLDFLVPFCQTVSYNFWTTYARDFKLVSYDSAWIDAFFSNSLPRSWCTGRAPEMILYFLPGNWPVRGTIPNF